MKFEKKHELLAARVVFLTLSGIGILLLIMGYINGEGRIYYATRLGTLFAIIGIAYYFFKDVLEDPKNQ